MHTIILRLHHLIELGLLVVAGQRAPDFGNRAFAQSVDLLDLVIALQGVVLDDRHGLGVLVLKRGLDLGLLVRRQVELLRQYLYLFVDIRTGLRGT